MTNCTTPVAGASRLIVIGGGPAGLMAAERAVARGIEVDLYDGMGSVGRKFLLAGKGGLNLTHSEPAPEFTARYAERSAEVARWLAQFGADQLREWARGLGVETFVGSSGRVFPLDLKAAPLLRGWVRRLRATGVRMHMHHRWLGWDEDGALRFAHADGEKRVRADALVLALGGGSWPNLGSDGAWTTALAKRGVALAPLQSANCGFEIDWSSHFRSRHAGAPIKPVVIEWQPAEGPAFRQQGEFVISASGVEGSLIYALSAQLREAINRDGHADIHLDLAPGRDAARLHEDLSRARGSQTMSSHLRRRAGIEGAKAGLLYEVMQQGEISDLDSLVATIKALPLRLLRARPLAEAISTAGGVRLEELDERLMLTALPGVFCAGEMLDWEAPTGGYLLTASMASGYIAGDAAAAWLQATTAAAVQPVSISG